MKKNFGMTVLLGLLLALPAQAETVYYQPTPYPPTIPSIQPGVHIWDGWITSVFYGRTFIRDDTLKVGGWGDTYRTYIKFDVTGLPQSVSNATLWLQPYQWTDYSPTAVNFNLVTSDWLPPLPPMGWDHQPSATFLFGKVAPVPNQWWTTDITPSYAGWKSGSNNGLLLDPLGTNHQLDAFRSSRYIGPVVGGGHYDDRVQYRPKLQFDFIPPAGMPNFKLPLPDGYRWLLTNEVGGYECLGEIPTPDIAHQGRNYFSIDIKWLTDSTTSPYTRYNTPVLAAAGGKIIFAGGTDHHNLTGHDYDPNGFWVVIEHDSARDGTSSRGFTTRYIHLKARPARKNGLLLYGDRFIGRRFVPADRVAQGDQIGIMGTTGWYLDTNTNTLKRSSSGEHVHFGFRYLAAGASSKANGDGASSVPQLTKVIMEGLLLKSYQTECAVDPTRGNPVRIRYYPSTNAPTGN